MSERSWIRDDGSNHDDGGGLSGIHRVHRRFLRDTAMGKLPNEEKGDQGELRVRHRQRVDGRDDAVDRAGHPRRQILPGLSLGAVLSRQRHVGDTVRDAAGVSHRLLHLRPRLLQSRHHVGLPISGHEVISRFLFLRA